LCERLKRLRMPRRQEIAPLIGQKFGMLVLLGSASHDQHGKAQAKFRCECGQVTVKPVSKVLRGRVRSCGCLRGRNRATTLEKAKGRRFGRLLVVRQAPTKNHQTRWVCLCDCGAEKVVTLSNLTNGSTRSCGCLHQENAIAVGSLGKGVRAHNWQGVGDISASYWGQVLAGAAGRGLHVGVTHQEIWELFLAQDRRCALTGWPIGFDPPGGRGEGTASLDRIDSTLGYQAGNLQWVHKRIQRMKWKFGQEEFIEACRAVAKGHLVTP